MLASELLHRCMRLSAGEQINADRARLGALGTSAMADRLLGVLRQEAFPLRFGPLLDLPGISGAGKARRTFRLRIEGAHVITGPASMRGLGGSPSSRRRGFHFPRSARIALGGDDQVLVERVGTGGDFDPICRRRVITDRIADRAATTHLLCGS